MQEKNSNIVILSIIVSVLGVVIIAGAFYLGRLTAKINLLETGNKTAAVDNAAQPKEAFPKPGKVEPVSEKDHVRGNRSAKIALIEYSDLECPFCKRFHPTAQQVLSAYGDDVMWVYRHFPLDSLHSKADKEAEAVECAAKLGGEDKFWALTDKIYEVTPSNDGLDLSILPDLAEGIGLDRTAFTQCLDSGEMAARVESDYQTGLAAGITGTPGNIIINVQNGKSTLLPGAYPFDQVKQAIDELL